MAPYVKIRYIFEYDGFKIYLENPSNFTIITIHTCTYLFQLFDRDSCTYTYLLADTDTKEAILIDPVIDLAERDAAVCKDLGLKLKYASKFNIDYYFILFLSICKFCKSEFEFPRKSTIGPKIRF